MTEVLRSKKDSGNLFNEGNRESGWAGCCGAKKIRGIFLTKGTAKAGGQAVAQQKRFRCKKSVTN